MKKFINWCIVHGGQIITALAIVAATASVALLVCLNRISRKFQNAFVSDNMWADVQILK